MRMILLFIILLPATSHAGPTMDITWSHRILPNYAADPSIEEGGIGATITSTTPVILAEPVPNLEDMGSNTWHYVFPWDWSDPLVASFVDEFSDTTTISITPQLAVPFQPSIHDLPVLGIFTAPAHLWDPETGIYVFGNYDNCLLYGPEWEFPGAFQWYEGSDTPLFTEQIGLRIHGGWSRHLDQKGLRFYFDDYGSSNELNYDFFGSQPSSFERLIIRTGRHPFRCFNAILCESIFQDLGHLGSRSRDIALYLNREYWGFYTLRERLDTSWVEHTLGYGDADYDLIKDGFEEHGSIDSWWAFLVSFAEEMPLSTHAWYEEACQSLDMTSYIDWQLINIFVGATDNSGHWNLVLLRLDGEPWQFVMWDEDMVFIDINIEANLFRFRSIINEAEFYEFLLPSMPASGAEGKIRWGKMLAGLMQNSEFKALFRSRYELLTGGMLSGDNLIERFDTIRASQWTEMSRHAERWGWDSPEEYNEYADAQVAWIREREPINHQHYLDFIEYHRDPVEFVAFSGAPNGSSVNLNWRTASEENVEGFQIYRGTQPDDLTFIAGYKLETELGGIGGIWKPADYSFVDTTAGTQFPLYYQLSWVDLQGEEHTIHWTEEIREPQAVPNLVINEYLALNTTGIVDETGTHEDWCEIFNAGTEAVDLGGMYLTDDLSYTTKWAFPPVTLPAGDFLVVWCDSDPEDGPLHTNFKLNASGEALGIFNSLANGNALIHSCLFDQQESDISEGFCTDGGSEICTFSIPTPGFPNSETSSITPEALGDLTNVSSLPNPFNPATEIKFDLARETLVTVVVYDLYGRVVRRLSTGQLLQAGSHSVSWDGKDETGRLVPSGTYLSRVGTSHEKISIKMQLVK
jgi:CotH kinase protein/Lamin Tail Domain/FlgD Ig-like domain